MSKRINVNPDHYKSQGRERPATLAAERMKMRKAAGTGPAEGLHPQQSTVATSPARRRSPRFKAVEKGSAEGRRPPQLKKRPAARPPAPSKRSKGRPSSGGR